MPRHAAHGVIRETGDPDSLTVVFRKPVPMLSGDELGISSAYAELCRRDGLAGDPGQRRIVEILVQLQDHLLRVESLPRRIARQLGLPVRWQAKTAAGVYLWGDVGRGKTMLMDLFFTSLATPRKSRMHFHRMMSRIHAELKTVHDTTDPLDRVAADIAREASVLCFDEFFVSDIGDAMILGRLLDGLVRRGVTLVATSNTAPSELYANGLQRDRFLPAIALLEQHTQVIHIGDGPDYRLRLLQRAGTYLTPDDAQAEQRLLKFFHDSAAASVAADSKLDILGRPIPARGVAGDVAWFDFAALCDGPRSPEDYIEIARRFQTVILSGVPQLLAEQDNAARRFVSMVDEFYDRRVKLVLSAAVPIDSIYRGTRLATEFRRTVSRLQEMQSGVYLHTAHRG